MDTMLRSARGLYNWLTAPAGLVINSISRIMARTFRRSLEKPIDVGEPTEKDRLEAHEDYIQLLTFNYFKHDKMHNPVQHTGPLKSEEFFPLTSETDSLLSLDHLQEELDAAFGASDSAKKGKFLDLLGSLQEKYIELWKYSEKVETYMLTLFANLTSPYDKTFVDARYLLGSINGALNPLEKLMEFVARSLPSTSTAEEEEETVEMTNVIPDFRPLCFEFGDKFISLDPKELLRDYGAFGN